MKLSNITIDKLKKVSVWNILCFSLILSEILTFAMNTLLGYLWWGKISRDLILIGTVDAFIVALVVTLFLIVFFKKYRELEDEAKDRLELSLKENRESEMRYRAIVEDQTELVCRFSPEGGLSFVNNSYCLNFGKGKEELIERPFLDDGRGMVPPEIGKAFEALTPLTPITTFEHTLETPGKGNRRQLWTGRAIFDKDNRLIEYQAVGLDITERSETEAYRQRVGVLQQREEICRWLHDDLGSDLFNIILITEIIQQKQVEGPEIHHFLDWIADASRNALNSVRSYINFAEQVGPAAGDLVAYMKDYGQILFKDKKISFKFSESVTDASLPLLPMQSFSVYLIYKEAITNILKHARAGKVEVLLAARDNTLRLTIEDDGRGFSPEKVKGKKYGTKNIVHRARLIGGEIVFDSAPGRGTRLHLTVPV